MLNELSRQITSSGEFLQLEKIIFEGGKEYEACSRKNQMNAVAGLLRHTENSSIILLEQYRYPVKNKVIELVAGLLDKPQLTKEQTLIEEIEEETGYTKIINTNFLCTSSTSPGMISELTYLYDVEISGTKQAQNLSSYEDIKIHEIPDSKIAKFILSKAKEGLIISPQIGLAILLIQEKTGKILY